MVTYLEHQTASSAQSNNSSLLSYNHEVAISVVGLKPLMRLCVYSQPCLSASFLFSHSWRFSSAHVNASQVFLSHCPRISVDRAANDRLKAFLAALCTIFAVRTSRVHGSTATVTIQVQSSIRHFGSDILISTSNKK